jgi:hypothetical protein
MEHRLRRSGHGRFAIDPVLESEVTTMRFIRSNTTIPVPEVFHHDARFGAQNPVDVLTCLWKPCPVIAFTAADFQASSPTDTSRRYMTSLLRWNPFPQIGIVLTDERSTQ